MDFQCLQDRNSSFLRVHCRDRREQKPLREAARITKVAVTQKLVIFIVVLVFFF